MRAIALMLLLPLLVLLGFVALALMGCTTVNPDTGAVEVALPASGPRVYGVEEAVKDEQTQRQESDIFLADALGVPGLSDTLRAQHAGQAAVFEKRIEAGRAGDVAWIDLLYGALGLGTVAVVGRGAVRSASRKVAAEESAMAIARNEAKDFTPEEWENMERAKALAAALKSLPPAPTS